MRRRRGALTAWGIALALLFSACHNGSGGTPVRGGTLRVSVRDLGSLDPAAASGRGALLVVEQLFDPLTRVDGKSGKLVPDAAASWTRAPNGLSWTFTLAKATFHDGTPVTATDFKAAFDRVTRKSTGSERAFQLEAVKGFRAVKIDGTQQSLAGVVAVNPTTLRIDLDRPFDELPVYLADPALGPLAKSMAANPALLQQQPIGNGPFKMAKPRTANQVVLDRFDGRAGRSGYLDRLEVDLQGDSNQAWHDFLAKRTDVAEVPTDALSSGRAKAGEGGFTAYWAALYYGPNLHSPKFAKPAFRQAISLAIDRKRIAQIVYGGTKEPASGLIPRGVRGFAPNVCSVCVLDQDRARQLVQQAYGSKPPVIVVDHLDDVTQKAVAEEIVRDLKAVGVNSSLRAHKSKDYLAFLQSGQDELAEYGWLTEVPSPDGFLAQQLRTGSVNNHTGYSTLTFDRLIDQARATPDEAARLSLYRQAEARSFDLMPLIPIVFFRNHVGVADRVHGLRVDGAGLFDAAAVWIH